MLAVIWHDPSTEDVVLQTGICRRARLSRDILKSPWFPMPTGEKPACKCEAVLLNGRMTKKSASFKEEFARFLEEPARDRFRDLLKHHHGELPQLEFKGEWPETPKLVKLVLGIANSGGGCLVVGVCETPEKKFDCNGVAILRDKADIDKQLRNFLPQPLMDNLAPQDFSYEGSDYGVLAGKSFQTLIVLDDPSNIPFMPVAETTGLRRTAIYVRRMASTEEGSYDEIQTVINRRIATGNSNQNVIDLHKHLEDLRILYMQQERYFRQNPMGDLASRMSLGGRFMSVGGEMHRRESFEDFTTRMIKIKKRQIEDILRL